MVTDSEAEVGEIQEVLTISDLDTLRLISDPLRLQVLQTLAEERGRPTTVKQIARRIGTPATKLYYHVNLLEEHGLIRVSGSRVVSGIIEKSYVPTARNYAVDSALFALGAEAAEAAAESLASIVQGVVSEVRRGIVAGAIQEGPSAPANRKLVATKMLARMDGSRAAEFQARLHELIRAFDEADSDDPADDGTPTYALLIAHYPLAEAATTDEEEPSDG